MKLHAITLVSVSLNIFVLTEINAKYSESIQTPGYNEYCDLEKNHCKNNQTQECINSVCKCREVVGLNPDEKLVFVEEIQKCLPIAQKSDGWGCRYNAQCKESKYGHYSRCLTGKYSKLGSCECYDEISNRPVQLVDGTCTVINLSELTISSSSSTWSCNYDYQCANSTLGRFSRCNTTTGRGTGFGACECFDTDGLKREIILNDNVCHLRKEYGQSCKFDGECNATIVHGICLGSPNGERIGVCKCAENFRFEPSLKECLKLGTLGSACRTDFQCFHIEALGHLSRCDGSTKKCVCWDSPGHGQMNVQFHGGQCHYARGVNQTCSEKVECILGLGHENADCLIHESYNGEKVCQCPNGLNCKNSSGKFMLSTVLVIIRVVMTAFFLS